MPLSTTTRCVALGLILTACVQAQPAPLLPGPLPPCRVRQPRSRPMPARGSIRSRPLGRSSSGSCPGATKARSATRSSNAGTSPVPDFRTDPSPSASPGSTPTGRSRPAPPPSPMTAAARPGLVLPCGRSPTRCANPGRCRRADGRRTASFWCSIRGICSDPPTLRRRRKPTKSALSPKFLEDLVEAPFEWRPGWSFIVR